MNQIQKHVDSIRERGLTGASLVRSPERRDDRWGATLGSMKEPQPLQSVDRWFGRTLVASEMTDVDFDAVDVADEPLVLDAMAPAPVPPQ